MRVKSFVLVFFLLVSICNAQAGKEIELNTLSELFLQKIKRGEDTKAIQEQLAKIELDVVVKNLKNDAQKLAFWVNIYNAFIQVTLTENPNLYENRGNFFSKDRITIAGYLISFDKIEHGIIRRSQSKLGLGYVKKGFPDKFERLLRVENPDYRIHFALNCGAKSCPPIRFYSVKDLDEQLDLATRAFLESETKIDAEKREVKITRLFLWFHKDFGGNNGIRKILKNYLHQDFEGYKMKFKNYSWDIHLDNYEEGSFPE